MQRARPIEEDEEYRAATTQGWDFANSRRARSGKSAAAGASTELSEGEAGPTVPRFSTLLYRPSCRPRPSVSVNVGETEIDIDWGESEGIGK